MAVTQGELWTGFRGVREGGWGRVRGREIEEVRVRERRDKEDE